MSLTDDDEDDIFPTNILPVDEPEPSLKVTRRAAPRGPDQLRMRFMAMLAPMLQGGSCDGLGSQKPTPSGIRVILLEAQAQGLEPKLLYRQAVQARPSYWPPAPGFEEVMSSGNARPNQDEGAVTREQAQRIATEHLGRVLEFIGARIRRVVAWEEMTWRRPSIFNAPPGIESSWVAYLEFPNEPPMSCSSTIIIVSRTTGAVLYAGDANDEG
jgi:hypothetical protein